MGFHDTVGEWVEVWSQMLVNAIDEVVSEYPAVVFLAKWRDWNLVSLPLLWMQARTIHSVSLCGCWFAIE